MSSKSEDHSLNKVIELLKNQLSNKNREDLLNIFREEVLSFAEADVNEENEYASLAGLIIGLKVRLSELKEKEDNSEIREIKSEIRNIQKRMRVIERKIKVREAARKYKQKYMELIEEGYQTTQKVTNDFLISAIAEVKALKDYAMKVETKAERRKRGRLISAYPLDWAGFRENKYPRWIYRAPENVRCENCIHWDREGRFCLYLRRKRGPNSYCDSFIKRGL